jgi:hypothetical protein
MLLLTEEPAIQAGEPDVQASFVCHRSSCKAFKMP